MQALMLAAGMGTRLGSEINKCRITIAGHSLFEHTVNALKNADIKKLTVVTGYRAEELEQFIVEHSKGLELIFIRNRDYAMTNNIWSLYLAREQLISDDTILLESDLIYEEELIQSLVKIPALNVAVIAEMERWMDGTTVLLDGFWIKQFVSKQEFNPKNLPISYKTVNIYKFNRSFLCDLYIPALEFYFTHYGKNQFYEMALKELVCSSDVRLRAFVLKGKWCEIDDRIDLERAKSIFEN